MTNYGSDNVSEINGTTNTVVRSVPVGSGPTGVVCAGGGIIVANSGSDNVTTIGGRSIAVGFNPRGVAAVDNYVLVANFGSGNVSVINASYQVVRSLHSPTPWAIASGRLVGEAIVANIGTATVTAIDVGSGRIYGDFSVGSDPSAVVLDPLGGSGYVANAGSNNVSVVSEQTGSVTGAIPVGSQPEGLAADGASGFIYVTNNGSDNVSVINGTTNAVVGSIPVGTAPQGVVWDEANGYIYVVNNGSDSVSIISPTPPPAYSVSFTESGLPTKVLAKDGWTVVLNGTRLWSNSTSISFSGLPNGTYPVLLTGPSGYAATGSGTVRVSGATTVSVALSKGKTATLTFAQKGLPAMQRWCVQVDGYEQCTTQKSLRYLNLTSGSPADYLFAVVSPLQHQSIAVWIGKSEVGPAGPVALVGSIAIRLVFEYPYSVTFSESGLASGNWSVTISGATETAAWNTSIVFALPNGTYGYKLGTVSGYTRVGAPKKAAVSGAGVTVSVLYTAKKGKSGTSGGPLEPLLASPVVPAAASSGRLRG